MKSLSPRKRRAIIKSALFNARMEGFQVPNQAVREGTQILEGKISADELVQRYVARYSKR